MDNIYSRKRIKIPKLKKIYSDNKNAKKFFSIFIIVLVSVMTFYNIFKIMNPIFEGLCLEKARRIGTYIMNNSSNKILNEMERNDIVKIEKDGNNNVLKTDVVMINKIASDIALDVEKQFQELENETIQIPLGAIMGSKYLAGSGPNVNIKIIPVGNIITEVKNEFESKGINQTVYRIYLELKCKVSVVTQYKTIQDEIVNQLLLVEAVIVGDVPESYYNLEGINESDTLKLIK